MKGVIRLGDLTSHGGKVIAASGTSFVHGIPVARQGDAWRSQEPIATPGLRPPLKTSAEMPAAE